MRALPGAAAVTAAIAFVVVLITSAMALTSPQLPSAATTSTAPTVEINERAGSRALAVPKAGYGFADGMKLVQMSPRDLRKQLDAVALTDAKWLRVPFNWAHIEGKQGTYDWGQVDRVIRQARKRGLKVLATISYAPDWARATGSSATAPPRSAREFGSFARAAAAHVGRKVKHWEIWNEPNLASHYGGLSFHDRAPQTYTKLLKRAYRSIKAENKKSTVVAGSLAAGLDNHKGYTMPTFVRRMYAAGAGKFFDAISLHPYTTTSSSSWRRVYGDVTEVRRVMRSNNHGGRKIWFTEVGHTTPAGGLTQKDQAKLLVKELREAASRRYVGPLFIFAIRDGGTDAAKFSENFGTLLTYDFKPKKMAARLAR